MCGCEKEIERKRRRMEEKSRGKVREREMKVANFQISMMMHVLNVRI